MKFHRSQRETCSARYVHVEAIILLANRDEAKRIAGALRSNEQEVLMHRRPSYRVSKRLSD
jgi:hypothetical protein